LLKIKSNLKITRKVRIEDLRKLQNGLAGPAKKGISLCWKKHSWFLMTDLMASICKVSGTLALFLSHLSSSANAESSSSLSNKNNKNRKNIPNSKQNHKFAD